MKYLLLFLLVGLNLVNLDAMEPKPKKDKSKKKSDTNKHVKVRMRRLSVEELPKIATQNLSTQMIDTPGKRKSPNTDECLAKQSLPPMYRRFSDPTITYKKSESEHDTNNQTIKLTSLERDLSELKLHKIATILSPRKTNEAEKK